MLDRGSLGFRWTLRLILWGVGIAIMIPLYRTGTAFHTIDVAQQCLGEANSRGTQPGSLFHAQRFSLCMFLKSSYLESRRLEPALLDVMSLGAAPCQYVGIWKSARSRSVYRVTMRDDSTFLSEPVTDFGPGRNGAGYSGYWGENEGRMVWLYDNGVAWPPDINRIESESPDKFTLIERNGERSEFVRERALESSQCPST